VSRLVNELTFAVNSVAGSCVTSSSQVSASVKQHEKRLAAAVYDRGRTGYVEAGSAAAEAGAAVLVGVDTLRGMRTVLCDLTLRGDPPEPLRLAVAETLTVLRVTWIALLRCQDGPERHLLDAVHAALQCELAAVEWTWSGGAADGYALARTLARRRERHRAALAAPPPTGAGLLIPREARATEPLPAPLVAAWDALARAVGGAPPARAASLRDDGFQALGAWRLGEVEAPEAAALVLAAIGGPAEEKVRAIAPAAPTALRAAS
jgi:hypothetical protein